MLKQDHKPSALGLRRTGRALSVALMVVGVLFPVATASAASIWVVDDNGIGVDAGDCTAGVTTHSSIQLAITASVAGDMVFVCPGTYTTDTQVVIDHNLDIIGADRATTIVKPMADTGSAGDARGWFLIPSGNAVNISNLTFDGTGFKVWQAFRHLGIGTFDTVAFDNILYEESGPSYAGTAIAAFGGVGSVDVNNSTFTNIGRVGVLYFGAGTTGNFTNNTYTGKGSGNFLDYAVEAGAGAGPVVDHNTISDNRGVAISDGSTSAGVLVTTFFGVGTTLSLTDNVITDNTAGVAIGYDSADTSAVVLEGNTITGNDWGIQLTSNDAAAASHAHGNAIAGNTSGGVESPTPSPTSGPFDATCNWWNDAFGPSGAGPGSGDAVSSGVSFMPWLTTSNLEGVCSGDDTPQGLKASSIGALQALVPTGDHKVDKKVEKAIKSLQRSLNAEWWVDAMTLDAKDGKKVFDEEKKAIQELEKAGVGATVIQALLNADEALAQKAIDDAVAAGGDQKKIDKANREMAKAADEIAEGNFSKAVEHFRKAWEEAQKALH